MDALLHLEKQYFGHKFILEIFFVIAFNSSTFAITFNKPT